MFAFLNDKTPVLISNSTVFTSLIMIFRFLLAVSVLALLGNVVAPPPPPPAEYQNLRNLKHFVRHGWKNPPPKHDAIELNKIECWVYIHTSKIFPKYLILPIL